MRWVSSGFGSIHGMLRADPENSSKGFLMGSKEAADEGREGGEVDRATTSEDKI